ncbi:MAG: STAS domain-containing protein [Akkermansiaceae bacterium]|nr:STAS domain-containing protein [Akkermansiaceae bacterium]
MIALPLAIGFGIASGVTPIQGLWTAIVGGLVISLLGGSRFQIGGPTGAFVPILFAIVARHGYGGLATATVLAGLILMVMGLFRMGAFLRYIPFPVVAGFTSGIAVIILLGSTPDLLGLDFAKPGHAPELVVAIIRRLADCEWHTLAVGVVSLVVAFGWPRVTRKVPAAVVTVLAGSLLVHFLGWQEVATIKSKFNGIPTGFPGWQLPDFSLGLMRSLMGSAFVIAMLGGIESLLSATVADGMADTKHDSNSELIGQGIANVVAPFLGGFAVTGAIARTAANIRSGGRSPVSGVVHALVLLGFVLVAAPLADFIPLAALAAVLISVAVRMAEWDTFRELWHSSRTDWAACITTFLLTVVFDLTIGVGVGLFVAVVFFVKRMEDISHVKLLTPGNDREYDGSDSLRGREVPDEVVLFRFEGPMFFAAVEKLEAALRGYTGRPRVVVFRMRHVPSIDATALHSLEVAIEKMHRDHVLVLLTGVQPQPMRVLYRSGLADKLGIGHFCGNVDEALTVARQHLAEVHDG